MPTLVECAKLDVNELAVEEFDLERLALLSEPQPAAVPRWRLRGKVAALALATLLVSVLATLPASVLAGVCSLGN